MDTSFGSDYNKGYSAGYRAAEEDALAKASIDREEIKAAIEDLFKRRYGSGPISGDYEARMAEVTTQDDIDMLNRAVRSLDPYSAMVLQMHEGVWREFGKLRCGVCGRTPAQSEAIGYDCAREC